jgi:hypothetical protein
MHKRSLVIAMAVTGLLLFGASIAYTQGLAFPGLASPASPPVPHLRDVERNKHPKVRQDKRGCPQTTFPDRVSV